MQETSRSLAVPASWEQPGEGGTLLHLVSWYEPGLDLFLGLAEVVAMVGYKRQVTYLLRGSCWLSTCISG